MGREWQNSLRGGVGYSGSRWSRVEKGGVA